MIKFGILSTCYQLGIYFRIIYHFRKDYSSLKDNSDSVWNLLIMQPRIPLESLSNENSLLFSCKYVWFHCTDKLSIYYEHLPLDLCLVITSYNYCLERIHVSVKTCKRTCESETLAKSHCESDLAGQNEQVDLWKWPLAKPALPRAGLCLSSHYLGNLFLWFCLGLHEKFNEIIFFHERFFLFWSSFRALIPEWWNLDNA